MFIVTTEKSADSQVLSRAEQWSVELHCPLEPDRATARELQNRQQECSETVLIVIGKQETKLVIAGQPYHFHPNMAKLRLQNLLRGRSDQFVEATGLQNGSSLLDCTLGFGADAIVASHVAGAQGCIVGLECQPVLAKLLKEGLASYSGLKGNRTNPMLQNCLVEAMRRISVIQVDSLAYLITLEDNSFDVVYFDPMFRHTREQSSAMELLRILGNPQAVTVQHLEQAKRVAKQRVVLKERRGSKVFRELGITSVSGGKYSAVSYGIIEK